jgi:hypothetical protein
MELHQKLKKKVEEIAIVHYHKCKVIKMLNSFLKNQCHQVVDIQIHQIKSEEQVHLRNRNKM